MVDNHFNNGAAGSSQYLHSLYSCRHTIETPQSVVQIVFIKTPKYLPHSLPLPARFKQVMGCLFLAQNMMCPAMAALYYVVINRAIKI